MCDEKFGWAVGRRGGPWGGVAGQARNNLSLSGFSTTERFRYRNGDTLLSPYPANQSFNMAWKANEVDGEVRGR